MGRITNRVINKLKPQIEENNINTNENLRRIVQEELQLQNFKNNKPEPAKSQPITGLGSVSIDAEKPKTNKGKKQKERKKQDDEVDVTPGPSWADDNYPPLPEGDKSY